MKKIEMGKKYRTRDGRDVRLLCLDAVRNTPVIGLVQIPSSGGESIREWSSYGSWLGDGQKHEYDLVEISPYADIPIDAPGWARLGNARWFPSYFAGVRDGRPTAWNAGATSFSAEGRQIVWDEFTTTKPEWV